LEHLALLKKSEFEAFLLVDLVFIMYIFYIKEINLSDVYFYLGLTQKK
jgi:hypothetical protein